ncbi:hypothetical protein [Gordonia sp. MMO-8]|uniref:hypothetical protein n=1 Tax=Gordonia sp. MMO-8 TaxID=3127886 RepID=UPI0030189419
MSENEGQAQQVEMLQVGFQGGVPSQLADLRSLISDFTFAQKCATVYLNLGLLKVDEDSRKLMSEALWTSAAIAYRRGFTTGKAQLVPQGSRLKIPEGWYESLNPEYKEAHDEILEIANRQIAHHTGKGDHFNVLAFLAPPPFPRSIAGTAVLNASLVAPLDETLQQLGTLCQGLIDGLEARFKEVSSSFDEYLASQDLDTLYDAANHGV